MSSMSRLFSSLSLQESHQTLAVRHLKRGLCWIVTANATYSSSTVLTATNFQNESKARHDFSVPSSFLLGTPMFHWFHSPSKKLQGWKHRASQRRRTVEGMWISCMWECPSWQKCLLVVWQGASDDGVFSAGFRAVSFEWNSSETFRVCDTPTSNKGSEMSKSKMRTVRLLFPRLRKSRFILCSFLLFKHLHPIINWRFLSRTILVQITYSETPSVEMPLDCDTLNWVLSQNSYSHSRTLMLANVHCAFTSVSAGFTKSCCTSVCSSEPASVETACGRSSCWGCSSARTLDSVISEVTASVAAAASSFGALFSSMWCSWFQEHKGHDRRARKKCQ